VLPYPSALEDVLVFKGALQISGCTVTTHDASNDIFSGFLARDAAMLARGLGSRNSVRLSVRLSVTRVLCD